MTLAFKILIVLCTTFAMSFVFVYSRAPWFRSSVGRLLMADGITITWILVVQIWQIFLHRVPQWVQLVSMIFLAAMLAWRTALALAAQHEARWKEMEEIRKEEDETRRDR